MNSQDAVLIFGATGNIGGAAARSLLQRGRRVRAVTRSPQSDKARVLASLGAEVVQADMDDRTSLEAVFAGIERVFSVQSWTASGVEGEIRQGKLVADVAREAGVKHLVYGSAGVGESNTGVPHFESKLIVEGYMESLGLPVTAVRPGPFMELMVQKQFFPALGVWGAMPKVVGWELPVPWVAVDDIGRAIANIFSDPDGWIDRNVNLYGDVQSLKACRTAFRSITGRRPFRLPLPLSLFGKMAGTEFILMWRWMVAWIRQTGVAAMESDRERSRIVCPEIRGVESWLQATTIGHRAP